MNITMELFVNGIDDGPPIFVRKLQKVLGIPKNLGTNYYIIN